MRVVVVALHGHNCWFLQPRSASFAARDRWIAFSLRAVIKFVARNAAVTCRSVPFASGNATC
jgi:hypothetical protein